MTDILSAHQTSKESVNVVIGSHGLRPEDFGLGKRCLAASAKWLQLLQVGGGADCMESVKKHFRHVCYPF